MQGALAAVIAQQDGPNQTGSRRIKRRSACLAVSVWPKPPARCHALHCRAARVIEEGLRLPANPLRDRRNWLPLAANTRDQLRIRELLPAGFRQGSFRRARFSLVQPGR